MDAFDQRTGAARSAVGGPGRVNLIGEHTDYNDGYVMPFALAQRVTDRRRAARRRPLAGYVRSTRARPRASVRDDLRPGMRGWQAYVAGVVWALEQAGHDVGGADLVLASDVPVGAGLSSSAALECAVLTALADLNSLDIEPARPRPAGPTLRERVRRARQPA